MFIKVMSIDCDLLKSHCRCQYHYPSGFHLKGGRCRKRGVAPVVLIAIACLQVGYLKFAMSSISMLEVALLQEGRLLTQTCCGDLLN